MVKWQGRIWVRHLDLRSYSFCVIIETAKKLQLSRLNLSFLVHKWFSLKIVWLTVEHGSYSQDRHATHLNVNVSHYFLNLKLGKFCFTTTSKVLLNVANLAWDVSLLNLSTTTDENKVLFITDMVKKGWRVIY